VHHDITTLNKVSGIQNGRQNNINSENACTSASLNLYLEFDVCAAKTVT
jgi:hypothetical protein